MAKFAQTHAEKLATKCGDLDHTTNDERKNVAGWVGTYVGENIWTGSGDVNHDKDSQIAMATACKIKEHTTFAILVYRPAVGKEDRCLLQNCRRKGLGSRVGQSKKTQIPRQIVAILDFSSLQEQIFVSQSSEGGYHTNEL